MLKMSEVKGPFLSCCPDWGGVGLTVCLCMCIAVPSEKMVDSEVVGGQVDSWVTSRGKALGAYLPQGYSKVRFGY